MDKQIILEKALRSIERLSFDEAALFATEIFVCYPTELQDIALEWAEKGTIPNKTINNIELVKLHKTIGGGFVNTLRFLNIFDKNPQKGFLLFQTYARRTPRK